MPPIWVHFFLGLGGAALVGWWVKKYGAGGGALPFLALGLVVGPVAVDADLLVSSFVSLVTGFDTSYGKFIHRSVTHSIPFIATLILLGTYLWRNGDEKWGPFLAGFGGAVAVFHVTPDLFYLVPVKIWAPFNFDEVGPFAIAGEHFWKSDFTDGVNNIITGLDFLGDSLLYLAVFVIARRLGTASRFTERTLPILAIVNAVIYIPLTIFVAPKVSYDDFLIYSYIPGVVFIAFSTLVIPWKARDTFLAVGGSMRSSSLAQRPARGIRAR